NREERAQALSDEEGPYLRRDELPLVGDVGDLDGLPDRTSPTDRALAEPDRFRPYYRQVLRRYPVRAPRLKGLRTLVELVDDAAVASGQLNGAADDGLEHGLELERGADRSADLTERAKLRDRPGKFARARLHLVEQPHVLDRDHRLVGEGGYQLDLLVGERRNFGLQNSDDTAKSPFAEQRHSEQGAMPGDFLIVEERVLGIGQAIWQMNGL